MFAWHRFLGMPEALHHVVICVSEDFKTLHLLDSIIVPVEFHCLAMEVIQNAASAGFTAAKRALSSAPPNDAYCLWDASGVEELAKGEEAKAQKIAETMNKMQEHNFDKHRHAFRATHVKSQGFVKGTLTVPEDLSPHLKQGLFAVPGTYHVAARYANEPVFLQDDKEPGPRGMAMRVFDVKGERIPGIQGNKDLSTQDFFWNNAPMIELTDLDTCLDIMTLREKYFDDPAALSRHLKLRKDLIKQHAPGMLPNTHILSHSFYSQSAFRFGDFYGHMSLQPLHDSPAGKVSSSNPHNALKDWMLDYFKGQNARYAFKIQLGTSPEHHPTEDASVVWDEATAPYQTIGVLEFPRQNSFSQERRVFWEDQMKLNPWRGLEAHRPLGSINRLRRVVYEASTKKRDELNARRSTDVQSIADIP